MAITLFDVAMILVLLISSGIAFWRGLVREVLSVTAFIVAAIATLFVMDALLTPAERALSPLMAPFAAQLLVITAVFLLVYIAVSIATTSLSDAVSRGDSVGFMDRTAGLAFGLARGLVVAAIVLILYASITAPQDWRSDLTRSKTYPLVRSTALATLDLVETVSGPSDLTAIPFPEPAS